MHQPHISQQEKELELISLFLTPSSYLDSNTKIQIAKLFLLLVNDYIKVTAGETFYRLPYKEISEKIYEDRELTIRSNELISFSEVVRKEIDNLYNQLKINDQANDMSSKDHINECFNKFIQHITLALTQKAFILESAEEAGKIATLAKKQAKKAKDMSDGMVTNFVTILGIFATIIITVFGGINLIGSTVKLLEGNSRLSYLVFVVSFLMICLLTLIQMLTLWVSGLNSKSDSDSESNDKNEVKVNRARIGLCKRWMRFPLYTKSILVLSILILLSLMCISCLPQKEKASSENPKDVFRSETTTGININIDSKSKNDIPTPVVNTLQPVIDEMLDSDSKR